MQCPLKLLVPCVKVRETDYADKVLALNTVAGFMWIILALAVRVLKNETHLKWIVIPAAALASSPSL